MIAGARSSVLELSRKGRKDLFMWDVKENKTYWFLHAEYSKWMAELCKKLTMFMFDFISFSGKLKENSKSWLPRPTSDYKFSL